MNLLQPDTLGAERWRRIESVLDLVLEAEPHEVPALLERHCAGHPELRREIEALLEADGRAAGLMALPAATILASFADESPPTRIGRYAITGTLGRGGMGVVYDGVDAALGRRVALKSLPPGFAHDPARLERFLCEARLLAALQSPQLGALHGIAREGSERYLVLERIEGTTLAERLAGGPVPLAEALDVAAQVAAALAEVHVLGIVHRDLKPANIMLTPGGLVKLLDLGLAESAARAGEDGHEWARAGTPGWMSPEQISGAGQDARSDVFAWGALAWQCLTGEVPFAGETAQARIAATLERTLDPAALPAAVPAPVREAVLRALARDAAARPADGAELTTVFAGGGTAPPAVAAAGATPLIGRTRELALAEQLIARAPLVTLTGAAGFGKSRLARELAARSPGCWFADLAACVDRAALETAVAEAAGLRGLLGNELLVALADAATPATLLILDGGDAAVDSAAFVAEIRTRVPALRMLAARRERFAVAGEEVLRLTPLALPDDETATNTAIAASDAVKLFESCARIAVPGFVLPADDLPLVAAICRRLEGVPLAIELAAARLRDQPLAALASEQLNGDDDTLVAAIHASLATLGDPEQKLFRALAVFRGGWELDTAATVAWPEGDRFDALDALAQLLERSLVTIARADRSEPRYRFLEPVREVALSLAERAGETAALRERHRDAYLATTERLAPSLTSGSAQARGLAWLEAEHENILAALEFDAPGDDAAQLALRLAAAVWWFWYVRGHFARGRAALAQVLARPGAESPTPARALALFAAGGLAAFQGDLTAGRRLSLEALALFEAQGDTLGIARACSHVALCDADEQRFDAAVDGYARAIAIFRERGDARRLSATLNSLGVLERLRDDFAAAWDYHDEALAHFRHAGDRDGTVVTLVNLALAGARLGRADESATQLAEALAMVRDLRARRAGAAALEAAAELLAARGADGEAARALGTGAALRSAIRLPAHAWWRRMTEGCRARLAQRMGHEAAAHEFAAGAEQKLGAACASAIAALSLAFGQRGYEPIPRRHTMTNRHGMLFAMFLAVGALCVPASVRAGGDKICDVCMDEAISDTASSPGIVATARRIVYPGYHRRAVFVGTDHHVRYADGGGAAWSIEVVDPASRAGGLAMDFDDQQRPIVSYHDSTGSVLLARRLAAGGWAIEPVALLIGATGATSMARMPDVTGIAFLGANGNQLFYAEQVNGSPWSIQPVASVLPGSADPSLLIDGATRAISYRDGPQGVLRLATMSPGQPWTTQLVDDAVAVGGSSSLIGHAGEYGIAYYDALNADLRYARNIPGGWAIDVVDGIGRRVGRACAAVLLGGTPSDAISIAYYDQSFGDLDYAAKQGPAWLHTWIDSQGNVGNTLSAGVGPFGIADTVSIVYTDPAGDLFYLERAAAVVSVRPGAASGALRASWQRDAAAAGGRVRFRMPASGEASVTILDPQGRHVAQPLHRVLAAGPAEVSWDGRDDGGRRVGAGVYFARVVVPGAAAGLRGVVLH